MYIEVLTRLFAFIKRIGKYKCQEMIFKFSVLFCGIIMTFMNMPAGGRITVPKIYSPVFNITG